MMCRLNRIVARARGLRSRRDPPAVGRRCRAGPFRGACGGQVVDAGRAVDDRRLGRQPLVAVGGVRATCGGVRRAARSTPMTAPMSHSAKATDAMPALQKPDRHSTATA